MLNLLVFTLFCLAFTSLATWRYRSMTEKSHTLSNNPIYWFVSFIAALLSSAYSHFGSVPIELTSSFLLFSGIAATLAIVGYSFHSFFKTSEPSFIENVIDFTLFGMQRLLIICIPAFLLQVYATQASPEINFYLGNIIVAWIGVGACYGAVRAVKIAEN